MPIRTQRLEAQPQSITSEEWQLRLERLQRRAVQAIEARDYEAWRSLLGEAGEWPDEHRRLQGDMLLWQSASTVPSPPPVWSQVYVDYAEHLFATLRADSLDPTRWNLLAVVLYELGELRSAEHCWRAVEQLWPEHPQLAANLRALRRRRKRQGPKRPFSGALLPRLQKLARSAEQQAGGARLPDPAGQRLSLAMIVKDEEEMLPDCLASVQGLVDEIIIVDTGSSDRTVEIAEQYGATVVHFAWTGSFAEARNVSLDHAGGDWILHLDADERLAPGDAELLRPLLARTYLEGFTLVETNYTGDAGSEAAVLHAPLRVWRHRPEYRFEGAIHEQKSQNMPHYLPARFQSTDLRILHYGYLKERIQARDKSARNLRLLEQEAEHSADPFNRFNLGNEYALLGEPEKAAEYYAEAWSRLQDSGDLEAVGYGGMLAKGLVQQTRLAGKLQQAAKRCLQGLKVFPRHTDLVLEQGYLTLAAGELEQAEAAAQQALQMGEAPAEMCGLVGAGSFLALSLLGEIYERQGRGSEAIAVYRKSLHEHPEYLGNLGNLARALLREGSSGPAVIEELEPYLAEHLVSAGLLVAHSLYEQAEIAPARALYSRVLEAQPQHPVARVGLVECALSEGRLEEAIELCADAAKTDQASAALLRSRLFALLALGQYQPAAAELQHGDLLDDADRLALSAWAGLYQNPLPAPAGEALLAYLPPLLRLQQLDEAGRVVELAEASQLPYRRRCQLCAEAFLHAGYLTSAAEAWLEAIDALGPDAEALYGLAQIALAEERPAEALALAEDALEIDAEHVFAQRLAQALQ